MAISADASLRPLSATCAAAALGFRSSCKLPPAERRLGLATELGCRLEPKWSQVQLWNDGQLQICASGCSQQQSDVSDGWDCAIITRCTADCCGQSACNRPECKCDIYAFLEWNRVMCKLSGDVQASRILNSKKSHFLTKTTVTYSRSFIAPL